MDTKTLPSQKFLNSILLYTPESGKLYWKARPPRLFKDGAQTKEWNANIWNAKNANKEAFTTSLPSGHLYSTIFRRKVLAHRVVWKMIYGSEPKIIDHIDGDPSNNKLDNLRSTTQVLNSRNTKVSKANTSGFNGVVKHRGKWQAKICVGRKTIHLGLFDSAVDAARARKEADVKFGFHPNHGRR